MPFSGVFQTSSTTQAVNQFLHSKGSSRLQDVCPESRGEILSGLFHFSSIPSFRHLRTKQVSPGFVFMRSRVRILPRWVTCAFFS